MSPGMIQDTIRVITDTIRTTIPDATAAMTAVMIAEKTAGTTDETIDEMIDEMTGASILRRTDGLITERTRGNKTLALQPSGLPATR